MPMVISSMLLIIYMWLFQYDRCLMELNIDEAIVKSEARFAKDNNESMAILKNDISDIDYCRYILWEDRKTELKISRGVITVSQKGSLVFPFKSFAFWGGDNLWSAGTKEKVNIISPVNIVRICKSGWKLSQ